MPGPAIHYITANKLEASFAQPRSDWECESKEALAETLEENPTALAVGSLGPDFLLFNMNDWGAVPENLIKVWLKVSDTLAEFKQAIRNAFPIIDEIRKWADEATETSHTLGQVRDMITQVRAISGSISDTVTEAVKATLLDKIDAYSILSHPIQNCVPEGNEWWWFDVLHYRQTGAFATKLLDLAEASGDDQLRAYSLGYLSHFAADVVGHPYVNTIARGPYRTHKQRHVTVERFQDVWAWQQYNDEELVHSKLHQKYRFGSEGAVQLPPRITSLVSKAATSVYGTDWGSLTPAEVDSSYRHWYRFFRNSTEGGALKAELPRYEPPNDTVLDALNRFTEEYSDFAEELTFSGRFGLEGLRNFFKELAEAVLSAVALALALVDYVTGELLALASDTLYQILSMIYQGLYAAYETFHFYVAALGFTFPLRHQLARDQVRHLWDPRVPDARGRSIDDERRWPYPTRQIAKKGGPKRDFLDFLEGSTAVAHLIYPPAEMERQTTTPAPETYTEALPNYYIDGSVDLEPAVIESLSTVAPDDAKRRAELREQMRTERLGNAVGFTVKLFCNYDRSDDPLPVPDLNLDGDRGFAYPPWRPDEGCDPGAGAFYRDSLTSPVKAELNPDS